MRRSDAAHENSVPHFATLRVEHRAPDGVVRVLAVTTTWSVARSTALTWRDRTRRDGQGGDVVIVNEATGAVAAVYRMTDDPRP